MQVALFIGLSSASPEPFPLSIFLSPPVCCFSLLICHIAEVSPLSPDLFMIRLLISFTMTPESASQIKILQAVCVPCSAHCVVRSLCVCIWEQKEKIYESACSNNLVII